MPGRAAITGNGLFHATDKAEAAAPEATEAAPAAPAPIAGTPDTPLRADARGKDEFDFAECPLL
jgi:hypothetical protein